MQRFNVSEIPQKLAGKVDVFICCASYETRCRTIAGFLEKQKIGKVLICLNSEIKDLAADNRSYLQQRFQENHIMIELSLDNPLSTADNLRSVLNEISSDKPLCYLVDISTFTHESLLIMFKLLILRRKPGDTILLAYNNASEYSPGKPTNEKWLSNGVSEVRTILGYPGEIVPSKKSHLIVLVGYEHERAAALISVFEPDVMSLGYGKSGSETGAKHHETNMYFLDLVNRLVSAYPRVNRFEFSSNNPLATKTAILEQAAKYPENNQVVAPMNTKLSTVGAGLAAIENPGIQICYAKALQYNYNNYSSPGIDCYLIELGELIG